MVVQILEVGEKEVLMVVPLEFLAWLSRWMVTGCFLGKCVYRRRKGFLRDAQFSLEHAILELPVKFHLA